MESLHRGLGAREGKGEMGNETTWFLFSPGRDDDDHEHVHSSPRRRSVKERQVVVGCLHFHSSGGTQTSCAWG